MEWSEFSFILSVSEMGIGVFAAYPISKGTILFTGNSQAKKRKIVDIPPLFRKYCIYLNDDECLSPERFDRMEIGWYINHSFEPNISRDSSNRLVAIRDIKENEEILIDYNELNEPKNMKEEYYIKE